MRKFTLIVSLIFAICLIVITVNKFNNVEKINDNDTIMYEIQRTGDSNLEEAISRSNVGLIGEFIAYKDKGEYIEFEFVVDDILYGNVLEENINICVVKGEEDILNMHDDTYTVGEDYLLILCRHNSLFREYARYSVVNDIYIPMNNMSLSTFKGEKIQVNGNLKSYIKNYARKSGYTEENIPKMFRNEDLETVVRNCDVIVDVDVLGVAFEGVLANQNTYMCSIKASIKGKDYIMDNNNIIYINAFKDSLKIGESYTITLCKIDDAEKNTIFNQASPNGIIQENDIGTLSKISEWINE